MCEDYIPVKENLGKIEGLTRVFCGGGRKIMANALLVNGAFLCVNLRIFAPKELFPSDEGFALAEGYAK
ncbi:hypothetical protein ACEE48_10990 [Streptococcus pluranimalium]